MKKNLLFFIPACFYFFQSFAQIEKKAIYPELSGERKIFNYNTNGYQTGVSLGLTSHSTFGIFYSRTRYEQSPSTFSESLSTISRYGISYTYYSYMKKSQKWGWSLNGSAAINRVHTYFKPTGGAETLTDYSTKQLIITPGLFFKTSSRVMFTANVGGFTIYDSGSPLGETHSSFGGDLNLGIRISLFGKKHK